jgi:lysophospholipase L1-like esterase
LPVWFSLLWPLGRTTARATTRFLPPLRRAFARGRRELYVPVAKDPTLATTPLLERFSRLLFPMPFFAGVILGLVLCIVGGHLAARSNLYSDRNRFFFQISPEGNIFPTLENLLQFVRQKAPPDKILVLAAGSSISLGVGQQNNYLWTDLLQRTLGDEFAVVNVSFRSAKFTSIGLPLLEILSQEYPRLLFVTESRPGYAPGWMQYDSRASSFYPYNYLLFQACLSGKLLPNPERDRELWDALHSSDEYTQLHAREDLIRAVLERATHASDLWNVFSYRFFFTLFSPVQSSDLPFWAPRKQLADDAWAFTFDREQLSRDQGRQLSVLKATHVDQVESSGNGEFKLSAAARENFAAIEKAFPDQLLRARTLFLVTPRNPYLTQELDPTEKQSYEASLRNWSETLNDAGFQAFPLGRDYDSEDFIDAHHFSNRGAPKMAADVAARVRRMAERNGWTNQAMQ